MSQSTVPIQKLKHLQICKNNSWESNPHLYSATVIYEGSDGSTTSLPLNPEISEELLKVIGPLLVKHSTAIAQSIADNILLQLNSINQPQLTESSSND